MTCEHRACQSIDLTAAEITLTERPSLFDPDAAVNTWFEATGPGGRFLGEISDHGYAIHPNHGGGWRHDWLVIAGGSAVLLGDQTWVDGTWYKTRESLPATVKAFARWCQRTSFGWRMALHG
jgi:hypothetical protein